MGATLVGMIRHMRDTAPSSRVLLLYANEREEDIPQRIEELLWELKQELTIVIVTHNLQQAARVSDMTAFFWLGKLIEYGKTPEMFTRPGQKLTEDYITGRFG